MKSVQITQNETTYLGEGNQYWPHAVTILLGMFSDGGEKVIIDMSMTRAQLTATHQSESTQLVINCDYWEVQAIFALYNAIVRLRSADREVNPATILHQAFLTDRDVRYAESRLDFLEMAQCMTVPQLASCFIQVILGNTNVEDAVANLLAAEV